MFCRTSSGMTADNYRSSDWSMARQQTTSASHTITKDFHDGMSVFCRYWLSHSHPTSCVFPLLCLYGGSKAHKMQHCACSPIKVLRFLQYNKEAQFASSRSIQRPCLKHRNMSTSTTIPRPARRQCNFHWNSILNTKNKATGTASIPRLSHWRIPRWGRVLDHRDLIRALLLEATTTAIKTANRKLCLGFRRLRRFCRVTLRMKLPPLRPWIPLLPVRRSHRRLRGTQT
ncbi:hypothetical protein BKA64DRAFT_408149 [Cadophora sp. MPI-SDFR-AT-0126]|nr:hypothetical protein BKA64DRAFT_408149 [Leotiomycetes sp. MPI-SDFR-AT-0126]